MAADRKVEIDFLAKDQVSKSLKRIEKNTKKLGSTIKKEGKEANKSFLSMGRIAETALGFGVASGAQMAARAMKEFVVDSVKSALLFEQQLKALEIQIGDTANALMKDLGEATGGLVSKLELLRNANAALALGLRKEDLPGLLRVATARAKIMGLTVSAAASDIIRGIGRASPLILDNLGIVFDTVKVYEDFADSLNTTVTALTKMEKAIALSGAAISSSESLVQAYDISMDVLADRVARGIAGWEDLKLVIGVGFNTAMGAAVAHTDDLATKMLRNNEAFIKNNEIVIDLVRDIEEFNSAISNSQTAVDELQRVLLNLGKEPTGAEIEGQHKLNLLLMEELDIKEGIAKAETLLTPEQVKIRAEGGFVGAVFARELDKDLVKKRAEIEKQEDINVAFRIRAIGTAAKVILDSETIGELTADRLKDTEGIFDAGISIVSTLADEYLAIGLNNTALEKKEIVLNSTLDIQVDITAETTEEANQRERISLIPRGFTQLIGRQATAVNWVSGLFQG